MGYRYDIAIRSTHKYAVRASGDIARVVDLPDGGVALLVIDGQGSGPAARVVAREVAGRLTALLEAGSSGEVAALAANQALTSNRSGQVSVSFDIVRATADGSIDLASFSTNSLHCFDGTTWHHLGGTTGPAGRSASGAPDLHLCTAAEARMIVIATDGVGNAGSVLTDALHNARGSIEARELATSIFDAVLAACSARPKDDVTLAILSRREIPAEQRFESFDYARDVR
jgi:serine phosphatase RsbU (regulator of sigma subunit)